MDMDTFREHFYLSAKFAREFAQKFLMEQLPEKLLFRLNLNSSYDGNPLHPDEQVYPEDSDYEQFRELKSCLEEKVISTLWRNGAVPEWIDLSVVGIATDATLLELLACGRFTTNNSLLYHEHEGRPPFHVTGPTLPVDYRSGKRFSIYQRVACWSGDELDQLKPHGLKVWSLELLGEGFKDETLAELQHMPNLELLNLKATPIEGNGLNHLKHCPKLRVLTIDLYPKHQLDLAMFATVRSLTMLTLSNLNSQSLHLDDFRHKTPLLNSLTVTSSGELSLIGRCPPRVGTISITAQKLSGSITFPKKLAGINLHLAEVGAEDLERLLRPIKQLGSLSLRRTPVSDATVLELVSRLRPRYLDVVDTGISTRVLQSLASNNPEMRMYPRLQSLHV